jgi:predicted alpha/beta superfamily hydrolase
MRIQAKKYETGALAGTVKVKVFLPDAYGEANRFFPVLYMHDGQDLYQDIDTNHGEESFRFLEYYRQFGKFLPQIIIVAVSAPIDPNKRTSLYSPFVKHVSEPIKHYEQMIEGKGNEYLEWITCVLKKDIDREFHSNPMPEMTGLCGASTGGVNAIYASLVFGSVFQRIIALSPSLGSWLEEFQPIMSKTTSDSLKTIKYLYMDVGSKEEGRFTNSVQFIKGCNLFGSFFTEHGLSENRMKYEIFENEEHKQSAWRMRFPDALRWAFQDC